MADLLSFISNLMQGSPQRFADFRRSENIEDRRKEKFNSLPQAPQQPNVFLDGLLTELPHADAPLDHSQLSADAGAQILDAMIQKYLSARQPGMSPPVDAPFGIPK